MGKIELELGLPSLLRFADGAMSKGQWYLAVQNLNDAFDRAQMEEEKREVYLKYAELFMNVNNPHLTRYAIFMAEKEEYKGGFKYIDFARFLPEATFETVQVEEERLTPEQVLGFNKVYTLILEKKYTDAIKLFYTLPFNRNNMASIVDALAVAINDDHTFDLDAYIVPLLPIIGEYASDDAELINILLTGGENTKLLAIESAKYFIEDNEDVDLLRDMGEVFFLASEPATAKLFFEKILSLCEIDETSLYYMYAVSVALNDAEGAVKYRAKYQTVCRFALPPMSLVDLSATRTQKKNAPEYLTLDETTDQRIYSELKNIREIDETNFFRIKDYCICGSLFLVSDILKNLSNCKNKLGFLMLCNSLMESAFAGRDLKKTVMGICLGSGAEGMVSYNLPNKAVVCEVTALHHRYGYWNRMYITVSEIILNADFYFPYHGNILGAVMKKCKEKVPFTLEEDGDFFTFVALLSYADKVGENLSMSSVASLAPIPSGKVEDCLIKYGLESPIL